MTLTREAAELSFFEAQDSQVDRNIFAEWQQKLTSLWFSEALLKSQTTPPSGDSWKK